MINEQMRYLKEKGLWGTVVSTTHVPERIAAWPCKELYIKANELFLK